MKSFICFIIFFVLITFSSIGQEYDSSIYFTADKEDQTHCGVMRIVSIIPQMTDPYVNVHFLVEIEDEIFEVEQKFTEDYIQYPGYVSLIEGSYEEYWDGEYNGSDNLFSIDYDSTDQMLVGVDHFNVHTYTALPFSSFGNQDTFKIEVIEEFGVIPFEELGIAGYINFNLVGLERNGMYYPYQVSGCEPSLTNGPIHPIENISSSWQIDEERTLEKYMYNKYGNLISIHHVNGCNLEIYQHTSEGSVLIKSQSNAYDVNINSDQFYTENALAGHFKNANNEPFVFNLYHQNNEYKYISTPNDYDIFSVIPFQTYSNIIFQQGRISIMDILGNTILTLMAVGDYSNGSVFENNMYAFYNQTQKTIHLYDENLELIQDLELLFPNIDGFKIVDGRIYTWIDNNLSVFSFQGSSNYDLDTNADISSISIHGDQLTWKSIDGSANKKVYFDTNNEIIIEDQPSVNEFSNSEFAFWNDSIIIYVDAHALEIGNQTVRESSIFQAESLEQLSTYDLSLDSLQIRISDNGQPNPTYKFDFKISNQGDTPIREIVFTTSEYNNANCSSPLIEHSFSINTLDSGESYTASFTTSVSLRESMCFYVYSPSGFADSSIDDNYKCFQGDITNTEEINANSFSIYPNPASDQITIDNYYGTVSIYKLNGELMLKKAISETIDISDYNIGIYFLKLKNEEMFRFVKR